MDLDFIDGLMAEVEGGFTIDNDRKADWAIEKVLDAITERDRITAIADARIKELQAQKQAIAERCNNVTAFLTDTLFGYFQTITPTATKTQSTYKLLSGKLVLKHQQPEYQRDEQQLLEWATKAAREYIIVKESVSWIDLKKATVIDGESVLLAETGEVIPGLVAKAREDVFEVSK